MAKGKGPRRPRKPPHEKETVGEEAIERQTQPQADLVPPPRRPPTAVGTETPPPSPPSQPSRPGPVPARRRPALHRLLQAIRAGAGAMLDLADATAEAITKRPRR